MIISRSSGGYWLDGARRSSTDIAGPDAEDLVLRRPRGMASSGIVLASLGYCVRNISCCSLTSSALRSMAAVAKFERGIRRLWGRGMLRSRGKRRSSRGGAKSMAVKRDCSQRTKVSIFWQERRNWSASARTLITYFFLCFSQYSFLVK